MLNNLTAAAAMKILYDHQTFSLQDYGGISRIFAELLKVGMDDHMEARVSLLFSNNVYLKELRNVGVSSFFKTYKSAYKELLIYAVNKLYSIHKLKTLSFDVFHPTYYDPYFLKYLKEKPFILTFHDLAHEKFMDRYNVFAKDKLTIEGKRTLITQAAKVIAVSEATKKDVIAYYGIDRRKIEVVHLATSLTRTKEVRKRIINEPYILFVGKRDIYKNFTFFLDAVSPLLKFDKKLKLVCAGGGAFSESERVLISELALADKVVPVTIQNDATLVDLYSNALCFVFPSLLEGFGIPVLEAFSCGCACALSSFSSLPEVAGNAALYFDPTDAKSIYSAIERLIYDEALRVETIRKGYERLSNFSWNKTRQRTYEVYRSAVL